MALIGRIKDNKLYINGEIIEGNDVIQIEKMGNIRLSEIIENEVFEINGNVIKVDEIIEDGI